METTSWDVGVMTAPVNTVCMNTWHDKQNSRLQSSVVKQDYEHITTHGNKNEESVLKEGYCLSRMMI